MDFLLTEPNALSAVKCIGRRDGQNRHWQIKWCIIIILLFVDLLMIMWWNKSFVDYVYCLMEIRLFAI
jgi:hypothetical protein